MLSLLSTWRIVHAYSVACCRCGCVCMVVSQTLLASSSSLTCGTRTCQSRRCVCAHDRACRCSSTICSLTSGGVGARNRCRSSSCRSCTRVSCDSPSASASRTWATLPTTSTPFSSEHDRRARRRALSSAVWMTQPRPPHRRPPRQPVNRRPCSVALAESHRRPACHERGASMRRQRDSCRRSRGGTHLAPNLM
jgi:hypothetical protein